MLASAVLVAASLAQTPAGAAAPTPADPGPTQVASSFADTFDGLLASRPRSADMIPVQDVVLRHGGAELILASGHVAFLPPIDGRSPGAVFQGRGRFRMVPPLVTEQAQLERRLGQRQMDLEIRAAALFYTDATEAELTRAPAPSDAPAGSMDDAVDCLEQALDWMSDPDRREFDPTLMSALLNAHGSPVFHAHLRPVDGEPLFFRVDQGAREEVSFGRKARGRGPDRYEVVTRYHLQEHYTAEKLLHEPGLRLAPVTAYRIDLRLNGSSDLFADAALTLVPGTDGGPWVPLSLHPDLRVDSVQVAGRPTSWSRGDDSHQLWIRVPPEAGAGTPTDVRIWYQGDYIERVEDWYELKSSTGWYPLGEPSPATFDLSFDVEDRFEVASVGVLVNETKEGGRTRTRWVTDGPVHHASFNVGEFRVSPVEHPTAPPVTLLWSEYGHDRLRQMASQAGAYLPQQRDIDRAVGSDLAASLAFFQDRFGALPVDRLYAAEILGSHGQAFPGLVHLSWQTFQWTGKEGYDEVFRAHEVAHQWWGLAVDPHSYHDTWLSEGLSEYSGLWYVQSAMDGLGKYTGILDDYRDAILERRDEAGPIWLGPRVMGTGDRWAATDYRTVVYQKGAWVFHMLRHLMMDLDEMDTSAFDGMLQDVYRRFRGRDISTEEFRAVVQQHIGIDMGWFFRQWVYGTHVPTYHVRFEGTETADGYAVQGTVRQEDVPEGFQMYVPILVDFGTEGWARMRVLVDEPVEVFDLPLMPRRPDDIRFNDMDAVLADVKQADWN